MADINMRKGMIDGRVLSRSDIKVGVLVRFPSGTGGSFEYKCVSVDEKSALFKVNKPERYKGVLSKWYEEVLVEFDVPDLTVTEWLDLAKSIRVNPNITSLQRSLLSRADDLGYVRLISYTQCQWTEYGQQQFKNAVEAIPVP